MFIIEAKIDYENDAVTCFDPTRIIYKLINDFPETIVCLEDYGWRDYDVFKRNGAYEGAIRIAENDARRRSPVFIFRLMNANGQIIKGQAERYIIHISSAEKIPSSLKQKLLSFFNSLETNQIEVNSYRLEHNDKFPD